VHCCQQVLPSGTESGQEENSIQAGIGGTASPGGSASLAIDYCSYSLLHARRLGWWLVLCTENKGH
jgi:hypothetical protein